MGEISEEQTGGQVGSAPEPSGETLPAKRQGVTLGQLTATWIPDPSAGLRSYLKEQAEQLSRAALMPSASMVAQIYRDTLSSATERQIATLSEQFARPLDWLTGIDARQISSLADSFADTSEIAESINRAVAWLSPEQREELLNPFAGVGRQYSAFEQELARIGPQYTGLEQELARMGLQWPTLADLAATYQPEPLPEIRVTQAGAYIELEPTPPAPVIETPKESEPAWQALLQRELEAGRATPAQMLTWLKRQAPRRRPGVQGPSWAEIELICLDYERNGHKYANQEAFARRHNISRATLSRYLEKWRLGEDTM